MNRELALANKVMKEANDFTGWGFSVVPQENKYLVGTSLERKAGQVLNIVFEIKRNGVEINTFIPECKYDEKSASKILEKLEFPVEAKGTNGEMFIIKSKIPFELLESDTIIIVREMMVSMVDAMTKIITGKKIE